MAPVKGELIPGDAFTNFFSRHLYHPQGVEQRPFPMQTLLHFLSCNWIYVEQQEVLQLQHSWQTGAPDLSREVKWVAGPAAACRRLNLTTGHCHLYSEQDKMSEQYFNVLVWEFSQKSRFNQLCQACKGSKVGSR